jgi:ATP synthase protein I
MPMGSREPDSRGKSRGIVGGSARQFAEAMELPFMLVGAVILGGGVGWLLDRHLHTAPWLMLAVGSLGFAVGLRDVLRRATLRDKNGK